YSDISGDDYLRLMRLPGYRRDLDMIATAPEGAIAAYVNGWIDPGNQIGELGPVGERGAYHRRGLTRTGVVGGVPRLCELGMNRVCVSTGESNMPALRLDESLGFTTVSRYLTYIKPA